MNRAAYRAARRELRYLRRWLLLNSRPWTTGCDCNAALADAYDARLHRAATLASRLPPPVKPWDADVLNNDQRRRRAAVLHRIELRRRERAAAAIDTRGMTRLQAAFAQINARWAA